MNKIFVTILTSLLLTTTSWATQYYVNASIGNDTTGNGSILTPWATISKCATTAAGGDTCNISTGTYRETITNPSSGTNGNPITFTGAGPGLTIVDAGNAVTGCSLSSGSIYTCTVGNISGLNQVYIDGVFIDQARYPQNTLLTTTSAGTSTQVIDTAIGTGGTNVLTSAKVVGSTPYLRVNEWTIDSSTTASTFTVATGTITLNTAPYFGATMPSGWGFYLSAANGSGLTWMLTYAGAWYYDNSNVLSLWDLNSDNPGNHTVEVSARAYGFNISSKNYITLQNMTIENAITADVNISSGSNITINNVSFIGGYRGVYLQTGSNDLIKSSTFTNQLFSGVNGNTSTSLTITANTINGAGDIGNPKVGRAEGGGVYITGSSNSALTITNNTINNSGYAGIYYYTQSGLVQGNTITNSCQVLTDCAGIYSNNNQTKQNWTSTIDNNTIINTASNTYIGTQYTNSVSHGIYLDDLSSGYTVFSNYIVNTDYGIFIHSGYHNTITNNVVKAARMYGFIIVESGSLSGEAQGVSTGNVSQYNTFETIGNLGTTQFGGGVQAFWSQYLTADILNFGTFNNNQYCGPNTAYASSTQGNAPTYGNTNYTLSGWRSYSGQDATSNYVNAACPSGVTITTTGKVVTTGVVTL